MKRFLALFSLMLVCACIFCMPMAAEYKTVPTVTTTYINPLYASEAVPPVPAASESAEELPAETYYGTIEEAVATLRFCMELRVSPIEVYVNVDPNQYGTEEGMQTLMHLIFQQAVEHTGISTQGDYLRWQIGPFNMSCSGMVSETELLLKITYPVVYYTTAEQEESLNEELARLIPALISNEMTDYGKVRAIYDYICRTVTYDYDNLNNNDNFSKYSAYAALINKTAVCQGYANLFYRMSLAAGVDARLITGTGNGGPHAWNIVKLDGKYYALDATWDAPRAELGQPYAYFLRCDANFVDHIRDLGFLTEEFIAAYPMADADYPIPAATSVTIDETNFPDPAFRAWVSMNVDTNSDGVLTSIERAKMEYVNVNGIGATTLKGIEHFENLGELYCNYNQLTELDVSKNKWLKELYCIGNQLTSLDLRANPEAASYSSLADNVYDIIPTGSTFDLSTLPGNFEVKYLSNPQGGTVSGTVVTLDMSLPNDLNTDDYPDTYIFRYTYACSDTMSAIFTLRYKAAAGQTISGTATSFGDADVETTIALYREGEETPVATTKVVGTSAAYRLENIAVGSYTLQVSKDGHVTEEYAVTVGASAIVLDVAIYEKGDMNQNGRIGVEDCQAVFLLALELFENVGIDEIEIGDFNGNGRIDVADSQLLFMFVMGS